MFPNVSCHLFPSCTIHYVYVMYRAHPKNFIYICMIYKKFVRVSKIPNHPTNQPVLLVLLWYDIDLTTEQILGSSCSLIVMIAVNTAEQTDEICHSGEKIPKMQDKQGFIVLGTATLAPDGIYYKVNRYI